MLFRSIFDVFISVRWAVSSDGKVRVPDYWPWSTRRSITASIYLWPALSESSLASQHHKPTRTISFQSSYTTFLREEHDQPLLSANDSDDESSYNAMHPSQPQYRSNRPDSQTHPIRIPLLLIAFICLFAYIDASSQSKSKPEHVWRDFRFSGFPEGEPRTIDEMRDLLKSYRLWRLLRSCCIKATRAARNS